MVARILAIRSTAGRISGGSCSGSSFGETEVVGLPSAGLVVGHVASGLPAVSGRVDSALGFIRASIAPLDRDDVDRLGDALQMRGAHL